MARGRRRSPKRMKITPRNRPRPARVPIRRRRNRRQQQPATAPPPPEPAPQPTPQERRAAALAEWRARKKAQKEARNANLAKARQAKARRRAEEQEITVTEAYERIKSWTVDRVSELMEKVWYYVGGFVWTATEPIIEPPPEAALNDLFPCSAMAGRNNITIAVPLSELSSDFYQEVPDGNRLVATLLSASNRERYQANCRLAQYEVLARYLKRFLRKADTCNERLRNSNQMRMVTVSVGMAGSMHVLTESFLRTLRSDYDFQAGGLGGDIFGAGSNGEALRLSLDNFFGIWLPEMRIVITLWSQGQRDIPASLNRRVDAQERQARRAREREIARRRRQLQTARRRHAREQERRRAAEARREERRRRDLILQQRREREAQERAAQREARRLERAEQRRLAAEERRLAAETERARQAEEREHRRNELTNRHVGISVTLDRVERELREARAELFSARLSARGRVGSSGIRLSKARGTVRRRIQELENEAEELRGRLDQVSREIREFLAEEAQLTRGRKRHRRGGKAPWKNAAEIFDLTRAQIDFESHQALSDEDTREHCFVYAMRQSELFDQGTINSVASMIYGMNLTVTSLKELCQKMDLHVHLAIFTDNSSNRITINPNDKEPLELALYGDHFFLNEPCAVSKWVVENYEEAASHGPHHELGWRYKRGAGGFVYDPCYVRTTGALVQLLDQHKLLKKLKGSDIQGMTKDYYSIKDFDTDDLSYCPKFCPPIEFKARDDKAHIFWFADFETTTDGSQHLPYLLVAKCQTGAEFRAKSYDTTDENVQEIWGHKINSMLHFMDEQCGKNFSISVVFHNLNYDAAFIIPYLWAEKPYDLVEVNGKIISFKYFHPGTNRCFYFRDSFALISAPLRDFGKMFQLEVEKEIFPYTFYSQENFRQYSATWPMVPLNAFLLHYKDPDELRAKLEMLNLIDGNWVDAHKYSVYYCVRDCEVLCAGFMKFRDQLLEVTGLDCSGYLTLPSIAYNYLIKEGVFEGCHNLTGQPLFFIRRCVLGGRCMLARNEKQDIRGRIADFDAVSLYPSAMARLYTLKGLPKEIKNESIMDLLDKDGFFAQVCIHRVPKALDFPLLAATNKSGIKQYANEPGLYHVDDITMRNIFAFHHVDPADVEVIRGYYYDEGKNYKIRETIQHLFARRVELKQQGNPLEQVYKLLMNSCYGKSIMKPILDRKMVVSEEKFIKILLDHATATLSYRPMGDKYTVTVAKDLISAESFPPFGVHILAMSKQIMSEVMVTAQDNDIQVFYTDTDSIHLMEESIARLSNAFKEKYGRDLIGKKLGQFHTDFPNNPVSGLPTYSQRFIGVGKKAYIDELVDERGNVSYHMRMKGVPNDVIIAAAKEFCDGNPIALYEKLYAGDSVTFNLLHNRVSFLLNRDMTYTTRDNFTRTVNF